VSSGGYMSCFQITLDNLVRLVYGQFSVVLPFLQFSFV